MRAIGTVFGSALDVRQPVGCLHQPGTGAGYRVGEVDAVGSAAELDLLVQAVLLRRRQGSTLSQLRQNPVTQRHCVRAGRGVELAGEDALHTLELLDRGIQVARLPVSFHERDVGFLIRRVELEQVLPSLGLTQQQLVPAAQPIVRVLEPWLIEIMRKQIAGEEVQRRLSCCY